MKKVLNFKLALQPHFGKHLLSAAFLKWSNYTTLNMAKSPQLKNKNMELKIRDWNAVKFRAYDEINKEMVYPRIIKESFSAISNGDLLNRYEIVMQYTGLNDRNNKQIYEGDFVKDGQRILFVKFTNGSFNFFSKHGYRVTKVDTTWFEVIGNIFETPNLFSEQS